MLAGILLGGCNSDGIKTASSTLPDDSTGAVSPDPGRNPGASALVLSGNASTSVVAMQSYNFTPTLSGTTEGVAFSISNKPSWATFNVANGALTGVPAASDAGEYPGIVITASRGTTTTSLQPFSIVVAPVPAAGTGSGSASLSWLPPVHNTDGTLVDNLAGYVIYHGTDPASLSQAVRITDPELTAHVLTDLAPGTHYFGIAAYTTEGAEGTMSIVGSKTIT